MFHLMSIKLDSRAVRAPVVTMETVLRALVWMISSHSLKIELSNAAQEIFPFFRNLICTLFCRLRNATYLLGIIFLLKSRGYYMAARRYEIYLLVLKNVSLVSANYKNRTVHRKFKKGAFRKAPRSGLYSGTCSKMIFSYIGSLLVYVCWWSSNIHLW